MRPDNSFAELINGLTRDLSLIGRSNRVGPLNGRREMSKIKNAYHDEICKLRETDDPYDPDWQEKEIPQKAAYCGEKEWEQNMYRHKDSLKWLEGIMKRNAKYQRDNEEQDND